MKNWLTKLISRDNQSLSPAEVRPADQLDLQKEIQSLRMEVSERERSITNLQGEVERLRGRQEQLISETVSARLESLFMDIAAPASQILTQADLLENQGKPVQARDVLAIARRMIRALERSGLTFDGRPGEQAGFDPDRHTPMNKTSALVPGAPVTIRFAGVMVQGKVIYKAIVE